MTHTYRTIARDERRLIRQAQRGDDSAMRTLLQAHDPFIRSMAIHYSRVQGFELDDAYQEARIGFVDGILRFDLKHKTRLLTYAGWRMKHNTRREMQNAVGDIRLPVWQQEKRGRRPIRAKRLDAPLAEREDGSGEETLADIIAGNYIMPDDDADAKRKQEAFRAAVSKAILTLEPRERVIARERLARHPKDQTTLAEIGKKLGISRERVRQVEKLVALKLRLVLAKTGVRKMLAA